MGKNDESEDEYGTLVVATLLILAIAFAGYWVYVYARSGHPPWSLTGWFAVAAAIVVVGGIVRFVFRR